MRFTSTAPVRTRPTNSVIERFFGTLKYEHLYRAPIDDGGALAMESWPS
jgi:transposase InsO family protein